MFESILGKIGLKVIISACKRKGLGGDKDFIPHTVERGIAQIALIEKYKVVKHLYLDQQNMRWAITDKKDQHLCNGKLERYGKESTIYMKDGDNFAGVVETKRIELGRGTIYTMINIPRKLMR